MAEVVVCKGNDGKLEGFGEKGGRAWAKFRAMINRLQIGETLHFAWHEPRSPGHHRKFFAWLHALFDAQEVFTDPERLRAWLTVGAGECDLVPGAGGMPVALPKSIAWHKLDEVEFSELAQNIRGFLWSPHARAFLWPTLSDAQRYDALETLHREFWG